MEPEILLHFLQRPALSQLNLRHTVTGYFFNICFIVVVASIVDLQHGFLLEGFPTKYLCCIPNLPCMLHLPYFVLVDVISGIA
jgi:hypothetical protein